MSKIIAIELNQVQGDGLVCVAKNRATSVNINTLRALERRGLIKLRVKTIRFPWRGKTVAVKDIEASLTERGKKCL